MFQQLDTLLEGKALQEARKGFLKAYDHESLTMLLADFGVTLEHEVNPRVGFKQLTRDILEHLNREGRVRGFLVRAIAERPEARNAIQHFARAASCSELIELADAIDRCASPADRAKALAESVEPTTLENRPTERTGFAEVLDLVFWLDGLPDGTYPPLLRVVEKLHALVAATLSSRAQPLDAWLMKVKGQFDLRPVAAPIRSRAVRAVVLEVATEALTASAVSWALLGDEATPVRLETMKSMPASNVLRGLKQLVDDTLANESVRTVVQSGKQLRFDFILPKELIAHAVDQLLIGDEQDEDNPPTILGRQYPVVVRPRSWCRPKSPATRTVLEGRFTERRLVEPSQQTIQRLSCPNECDSPFFVEERQNAYQITGYLLRFDTSSPPGTTEIHRCLLTNVLAVLWLRAHPGHSADATELHALLQRLLEPVAGAPDRVLEARRGTRAPWLDIRDHISLVWHAEPMELPADPFLPPTFSSE